MTSQTTSLVGSVSGFLRERKALTMSLRERQRLQVRADLQRAAFELFARDGFDAVTTEQIAAAAGVSPSTYFRHVRSKEDLLLEPVHEGGAGIVALVEQRPE